MGRGWSATRARKTGLLIFALTVAPVLLAPRSSPWIAVLLIGLAVGAHHAWSANLYASTSDMFPKPAVGAISGIAGMSGSIGGMLFPAFAGWLLDFYKFRKGGESAGYTILFAICGSAYVVAFGINHLLAPRFEQVHFNTRSEGEPPPRHRFPPAS